MNSSQRAGLRHGYQRQLAWNWIVKKRPDVAEVIRELAYRQYGGREDIRTHGRAAFPLPEELDKLEGDL